MSRFIREQEEAGGSDDCDIDLDARGPEDFNQKRTRIFEKLEKAVQVPGRPERIVARGGGGAGKFYVTNCFPLWSQDNAQVAGGEGVILVAGPRETAALRVRGRALRSALKFPALLSPKTFDELRGAS